MSPLALLALPLLLVLFAPSALAFAARQRNRGEVLIGNTVLVALLLASLYFSSQPQAGPTQRSFSIGIPVVLIVWLLLLRATLGIRRKRGGPSDDTSSGEKRQGTDTNEPGDS